MCNHILIHVYLLPCLFRPCYFVAAVYDRAAEEPVGGGANIQVQDGLNQHYDRRPPRGDAHDCHAVHEAGKEDSLAWDSLHS